MPEVRAKFPSEIETSVLAIRVDADLKKEVKKVHETDDSSFAKNVCTEALKKALAQRKRRLNRMRRAAARAA